VIAAASCRGDVVEIEGGAGAVVVFPTPGGPVRVEQPGAGTGAR
jgi:hypothetical protein